MSVRRRVSATLADQAVSSATTAVVSVSAARSLGLEQFGAFALAFSFYVLTLGLVQSAAGQVYIIHYSGSMRTEHAAVVVSTAAFTALPFSIAVLLTHQLFGLPLSLAITLTIALPILVAHDAMRSVFFGRGEPHRALLSDTAWLIISLAAWALYEFNVIPAHPATHLIVWSLGGLVSLALALALLPGTLPLMLNANPVQYLKIHRATSLPLVLQMFVALGALQSVILVVGAVAGLGVVAAIRGAQTLLGPLNVLSLGVVQFSVPELVRRTRASLPNYPIWSIAVSLCVVLPLMLWGALWTVIPDGIGQAALGESWESTKNVLIPMTLFAAAGAATTGVSVVFKALQRTDLHLKLNLLYGPLLLILGTTASLLGGGEAGVWGIAVAALVMIPIWWFALARLLKGLKS